VARREKLRAFGGGANGEMRNVPRHCGGSFEW